jgi:hypothetical protein
MDIGGWTPGKKVSGCFFSLHLGLLLRLPSSPLVQEVDLPLFKGPDGQFRRVARIEPMEDAAIGGWAMHGSGNAGAQLDVHEHSPSPSPSSNLNSRLLKTGYPFVRQSSQSYRDVVENVDMLPAQGPLSQLSAVERTDKLNVRKRTMNPPLKFMCGPLLRYDTIDQYGVWHGAALVVSEWCYMPPLCGFLMAVADVPSTHRTAFVAADAGSTYEPSPTLKYRWKPPNSDEQVEKARGTELYAYGERSEYVCVQHVATPNFAESPKRIPRRR